MEIIVCHASYGCETGCCGHIVKDSDDKHDSGEFSFSHPGAGEDHRKFAEQMIAAEFGLEHVADLDWDNCIISGD